MVDVRVRQEHKVQLARGDGDRLIFKEILPLFHAVIHKAALVADLDIGAASGNFMRRAEKGDFHNSILLFRCIISIFILHNIPPLCKTVFC